MNAPSELLRITLDTPNDTHMFCSPERNVVMKGGRVNKKAKDLEMGDYINGVGEVISVEKVQEK